jgi:hypothetical protein
MPERHSHLLGIGLDHAPEDDHDVLARLDLDVAENGELNDTVRSAGPDDEGAVGRWLRLLGQRNGSAEQKDEREEGR